MPVLDDVARGSRTRWSGPVRRWGILAVSLVLAALLPQAAARTVFGAAFSPSVQKVASVPVRDLVPVPPPTMPASFVVKAAPRVAWPAAGGAQVGAAPARGARAGSLPVSIAGPTGARVQALDQAAMARTGQAGALLRVSPDGAGPLQVTVDYSTFADAAGGAFGSRLRLVRLPDCALATPTLAQCQGVPLTTANDRAARTVSAQVTAAPAGTLVAVTAAPSGGGDFTATSLQPSSTWEAGDSSGGFAWSYPLRMPPGLGGPTPTVALQYESQSLDGLTAATNNQPSWIGDGFAFDPGFIQRTYRQCMDDGQAGSGDLCWSTDNATLALAGHGGELIQDASNADLFHHKHDDGTRVERLFDGTLNNGARGGEYWKVTTTDGVQYFFGRNRLPGWTTGRPETASVATVPVFGNNAGEPCNSSAGFAASWCQQAYRWSLDQVVDAHGSSMSYWYMQETNSYARNVTDTSVSQYVRATSLARIEYGTRAGSELAAQAPMRVVFGTADRCVTAGATCTSAQANWPNWPDVPWDQQCTSSTSCTGRYSPTFFTQKRLSQVTTQVSNGDGTWRAVEQWTLGQQWLDPGDGNARTMFLRTLGHQGLVGGATADPDITFNGVPMNNRVDVDGSHDPIERFRISSIVNESGGALSVTYSGPDCVKGSRMPASADQNTLRCFPAWWVPPVSQAPVLDWFNKYVATQVSLTDGGLGSATQVTSYAYPANSAAWHYDESELTPPSKKTWGQWRGYDAVTVTVGAQGTAQSQYVERYFRGMDGDHTNGPNRSVAYTVNGTSYRDSNWWAGQPFETLVSSTPGGPMVSDTLTEPFAYGPTATRARSGVTVQAYVAETLRTTVRTALDGGRPDRVSQTANTYDTNPADGPPGRLAMVDDQADTSTSADDRCTRYTYARSDAAYLYSLPTEAETVAVACAAAPNRAVDVISDVRTWYDGATAFGSAVSRGDVTRTEALAGWNGGSPSYVTRSTATYDEYGRQLDSVDALGRRTSIAYAPATGAPVTGVTTTDPMGWPTTTTLEPAWGTATTVVDPAGHRTDRAHDGLGRLTAVWLPGRDRSAGQTASTTYGYVLRGSGGASAVTTSSLNTAGTGYVSSYALFDGLLRPRQTQAPATDGSGGRVLSDIVYDSRGLTATSNSAYYNSSAPGTTAVAPTGDNVVPGQTVEVHDGAERQVASIFRSFGVERWRTTTAYGGDRVDVTPPAGGVATSAWTGARGNTIRLGQYPGGIPSGPFDATVYGYDRAGRRASVTDAMGNTWQWAYDQRGREIRSADPDSGTSTYTYDDAGQRVSVTDGRGVTLASTYDALGRLTAESLGSAAGARLLERTYDAVVKGEVSSTTRWVNGQAYVNSVTSVDAAGRATTGTVTIPSGERGLAGTYTYGSTYTPTGKLATTTMPAAGGLAAEKLTYGYDGLGQPATLTGQTSYVTQTSYDAFGQVAMLNATAGDGRNLQQYWYRDPATQRLSEHLVFGSTTPSIPSDTYYTYDSAGNVTSVADKLTQYGAGFGPDDTQCFRYDPLSRLADAWTPGSGDCTAAPSTPSLGGAAPYWQTYTYDRIGNRLGEVQHQAAGDVTSTYAYPAGGQPQPHTLTSVTTKGPGATGGTAGYTYDAAGNTLTRPGASGGQSLSWDAEGHLASATDSTGATTAYLYDADGNRLVSRDPTGATLYLPGTEVHVDSSGGSPSVTRFYTQAGQTVAVRSAAALTWLAGDHQGTSLLGVRASDYSFTKRFQDPFGAQRGGPVTWPSARSFLDGAADSTGLVHLGAREYDPAAGRFISVDPLADPGRPETMNPFAYAADSPVTESDGTGLSPCGLDPFSCQVIPWIERAAQAAGRLVGQVVQGIGRAVQAVRGFIHSIASAIGRLVSRIAQGINRAVSRIKHAVGGAIAKAKAAAHAVCYATFGSLSCSPSQIVKKAGIGQPFDCNAFPDAARCRRDLKSEAVQVYRHANAQIGGCFGICLSLTFQHGQFQLGTGVGVGGLGGSLTWDTAQPEDQGALSASLCAADVVGPCYGYGPTVDAQGNWVGSHHRFGLAFGGGEVRAGMGYTLVTVDAGNGHVTGPQDPIPPSLDNRLCRLAFWC
jgi:RHS repeat-associated protein